MAKCKALMGSAVKWLIRNKRVWQPVDWHRTTDKWRSRLKHKLPPMAVIYLYCITEVVHTQLDLRVATHRRQVLLSANDHNRRQVANARIVDWCGVCVYWCCCCCCCCCLVPSRRRHARHDTARWQARRGRGSPSRRQQLMRPTPSSKSTEIRRRGTDARRRARKWGERKTTAGHFHSPPRHLCPCSCRFDGDHVLCGALDDEDDADFRWCKARSLSALRLSRDTDTDVQRKVRWKSGPLP